MGAAESANVERGSGKGEQTRSPGRNRITRRGFARFALLIAHRSRDDDPNGVTVRLMVETAFGEEEARAWLTSRRWWDIDAQSVKRLPGLRWWEARELPEEYRHNESRAHRCFEDALKMAERYPHLKIAIGFSFRPWLSDDGILHCFNVEEVEGEKLVADIASRRLGLPAGYLAGLPDRLTLHLLARANRVVLPERLRLREWSREALAEPL
jgi:hypothetical protein